MIFFEDTVSVVKVAVSLLLALASWLLIRFPAPFRHYLNPRPALTLWVSFIGLRVIPFIIVYLIMDFAPRSDTEFFYKKAIAAFAGKMVYRDFLSYHGPLFGYLISLPLYLWYNAKILIPFMAIVEFAIVWATWRYYQSSRPDALLMAVLYFLLPMPFVAMILSSEEDIWFWGVGLITLAYASRAQGSLWIGIIWGLSMIVIKSMIIVLLVPLFFLVDNKFKYVLGLAIVGIPSIVILYLLMGDAFLMPLQHSGYNMTPNIVSITRPFLSGVYNQISLTRLNTISLCITMALSSWAAIRYRHLGYRQIFPSLYVLTFGIFMLAQPSAPGFYLFMYMIVVLYEMVKIEDRSFNVQLILLNFLIVIEPIIWVIYVGMLNYDDWHTVFSSGVNTADYLIQVVEVGLLLALVWRTFVHLRSLDRAASQSFAASSQRTGSSPVS
ncbi:hypothetical protein GCM10028803_39160 [Larkinella knui]|uniref:DUF2029 domain-containing protein n=1 Tax=Larkinella knui TaxID=2025310 RepID=A0A3P1CEL2_9BACT|nr:hypothetical protein [Larkinella knui]RRB11759.1 hypothetical protein EHT87_25160 [Larkinella knui]